MALLISWLIQQKWKSLGDTFRLSNAFTGLVLFYLVHLIGLVYTSNLQAGMVNLQVKLSIFLLPLLIVTNPAFDNQLQKKAFNVFTLGTCLMALGFLAQASYSFVIEKQPFLEVFYYYKLSRHIHPSYFAMFCCTAIANCLFNQKSKELKIGQKIGLGVLILFLSGFIYLLSSRAGFLSLIALTCFGLFYFLKNNIGRGITIAVLLAISLLFIQQNKRFNTLLGDSTQLYTLINSSDSLPNPQTTETRFQLYASSVHLIKENPLFGVGTGDDNDHLTLEYKNRNLTEAAEKRYNAHNQFLQTALQLGLPVAILLFAILSAAFLQCWKAQNYVLCFSVFLIILNFMFETMLNAQFGTMYFGFVMGWACKRQVIS